MTDETQYLYGVRDDWGQAVPGRVEVLKETPKTLTVRATAGFRSRRGDRVLKSDMKHYWLGALHETMADALSAAQARAVEATAAARRRLLCAEEHELDMRQTTVEQAMIMIEAAEAPSG